MATIGQPLPASTTNVLGGAAPTPIQQAASNAALRTGTNNLGVLAPFTTENQLKTFESGLPNPAPVAPSSPVVYTTPEQQAAQRAAQTQSTAPSVPVTPASTKSIYRIGNDIYDAATNTKIPDVATLNKDYAGAKEVAAPAKPAAETTPTTTATETKTPSNGFEGYDAALKAESDAKDSKIDGLLSQGYSDPNLIASSTGMTVDEVNKYINANEDASYKLNINKNANATEQEYQNYKATLDSITNGTFALTPTEQSTIAAMQAQFDKMRQDQIVANQNYEGATQTAEIRSGRQEFMNQISGGILKNAVDSGLTKIRDIENQAISAINEYKSAIENKNYKAAETAYNASQKYLSDKSKSITELHTAVMDEAKRQQDIVDASNKQITQNLTNEKLKQDIAKTTVEGLTPALSGATPEIIDAVSKYYGIDANMLQGSIQSETQKFDKEMINKGFRTINPADVEKMRSLGAEVYEYQGRAYMKEPELKTITNKGNVDFFRGTTKVGTSKLTGGGPAVGSSVSPTSKEEQKFYDYIGTLNEKVASGDYSVPAARRVLMAPPYSLSTEAAQTAIPDASE